MAALREIELREVADTKEGGITADVVGRAGAGEDLGREAGLRQRAATGSELSAASTELPLPLSSYSKLDVLDERQRVWTDRLVITSFLDLFVSSFVAILAFSTAWKDVGVSLYCIGLQAVAHGLSSLCTCLRFWKESRWGKNHRFTPETPRHEEEELSLLTDRRKDLLREQGLGIGIGCTMLLSAVALLFKAARKYKFWDRWYEDHAAADEAITVVCEVLAWKSGACYFLHAGLRYLARQDSPGWKFVNHIFWVSAVSAIFCVVLAISASYQKEWSWKAEPIAATILAIGCILEGMRICYVYCDDIDDLLTRHSKA